MPLTPEAARRKDAIPQAAPKFQHRHFAFIAQTIAAMPTHAASLRTQRESCARAFAASLWHTNPNFNRTRFLAACGVEE